MAQGYYNGLYKLYKREGHRRGSKTDSFTSANFNLVKYTCRQPSFMSNASRMFQILDLVSPARLTVVSGKV